MNPMRDALENIMAKIAEAQTMGTDAMGTMPPEEGEPSIPDGNELPMTDEDPDPDSELPESARAIMSGNRLPPMPSKKGMMFGRGVPAPKRGRPIGSSKI